MFSFDDFPALPRVPPPIHISSSPLHDSLSLPSGGRSVRLPELPCYSTDHVGPGILMISSIKNPNVTIPKPRKRDKTISSSPCKILEEKGLKLCQNPIVSSLFNRGLPRILVSPSVVFDRALREDESLFGVKK